MCHLKQAFTRTWIDRDARTAPDGQHAVPDNHVFLLALGTTFRSCSTNGTWSESGGVGKGPPQLVTPGRWCSIDRRRLSVPCPADLCYVTEDGEGTDRDAAGLLDRYGRRLGWVRGREHGSGRRHATRGRPPLGLARDGNPVVGRILRRPFRCTNRTPP